MIASIVAVDNNWGIGNKGKLLLRIPNDMKRFKKFTENHTIIMGRKTFESIPNAPLPNRWNIVVTNNPNQINNKNKLINLVIVNEQQAINQVLNNPLFNKDRSIYIIGGNQIYSLFLHYCKFVYVTKIFHSFEADTYFPNLDNDPKWVIVEENNIMEYNGYKYQYLTYYNMDYRKFSLRGTNE